ncbi:sensor histidine kinase/response regulator [Alcanivorax hongdengensis A-11-3]|uniref:histidine kinase n=1 Tax=Alcanivorax hongdengensis A-11-3 TaxID=1177179 RepID=L0W9C7_9GAMM|nr:hybrid sensor histidine kinase/response regulator [Alcanivorax hongdengensis]EKF73343.1 sensor histidine kinase/response regulator [Alcanivorax hongdengensis A-11-3]
MRQTLQRWLNRPDSLFTFVALTLLALAGPVSADPPPPYVINSVPDQARITIYSEYLRDDSGQLGIQALASGRLDDRFHPASRSTERLGISNSVWWVRVALQNELSTGQRYLLTLKGVPDATLYMPDGQGGYRQARDDLRLPWRYPVYPLTLPTGQPQVFYLKMAPHGGLSYSVMLSNTASQLQYQNRDLAIYALLYGALLCLALYNLIAGAMGGGRTYFYQCAFLLSMLLASLGLADFIDTGANKLPAIQPYLFYGCILIGIFAACGVGRNFLNTRSQLPRLHPWLVAMQATALISIVPLMLLPDVWVAYFSFIIAISASSLLLLLGYLAWHRALSGGGLYLCTTVLIGIPVLLVCLATLGMFDCDLELPQWLLGTLFVDAIILGMGLRLQNRRHSRMKVERQRAQTITDTVETTRRETLARIGHDVRTPLSGILGMSEILGDTPLTPNQRECVDAIQNSGEILLRIISDILEYSQLSTQGADINRSAIDIHELVMDAVELFRERAEEKQIELITHVHTNVPLRVEGDAGHLRQVMTNLVGALIRHGHRGELVVDISMEPAGRADQIRFEFSGTSVGRDTLEQLMHTRQQGNNGYLSLAIAEQLIDAMNGRTGHRDNHYWFVMPLPALEAPPPTASVDTSVLNGRSMLVVDDSSTVTRVLRHLALSWGMRVTACHDPKEALASLRTQANINEPFDVVILDHHMPGMDGMQLAARIHEDPVIIHPTVLVMLTGIHNAPTATQARNVGIHRVLSKPVSAPRLRQVLAEELGQKPLSPSRDDSLPVTQPDPSLKLLVAEDHHLSQKVIRGMLGKLGLSADIAANGREALEMASRQRYDLILMDCEMPEMDGFEATRRIRQYEQSQGLPAVPIVALTAHILREHRERSLAAGMNAHIAKPVELSVLRDALVRFTRGDATDSDSSTASAGTPG